MRDEDIVGLYWRREESALRETEETYGRYCFSIAQNILPNREDARECVNDAFMAAWNSIPPHRPAALGAYLAKLTRRICLKRWRDMRAQKRGGGEPEAVYEELSDCISGGEDAQQLLEAKELAAVIDGFLKELPDAERRVFICRYWYFDSISSISEQFGFSRSKVKSMLFRTRAKLRKRLEQEGITIES